MGRAWRVFDKKNTALVFDKNDSAEKRLGSWKCWFHICNQNFSLAVWNLKRVGFGLLTLKDLVSNTNWTQINFSKGSAMMHDSENIDVVLLSVYALFYICTSDMHHVMIM